MLWNIIAFYRGLDGDSPAFLPQLSHCHGKLCPIYRMPVTLGCLSPQARDQEDVAHNHPLSELCLIGCRRWYINTFLVLQTFYCYWRRNWNKMMVQWFIPHSTKAQRTSRCSLDHKGGPDLNNTQSISKYMCFAEQTREAIFQWPEWHHKISLTTAMSHGSET